MSEQMFNGYLQQIFKEDGLLSKYFPSYQPRKPQIDMALHVAKCFIENQHGLIEAGTGTGKSLGYAIAAALYSKIFNQRVIISTYTVTLQDQLINEELPLVKKILEELDLDLNYEIAKGRSQYLCKRKLMDLNPNLNQGAHYDDLKQMKDTLDDIQRGDRHDFKELPFSLWQEIMGDSEDCLGESSPHYKTCFIQKRNLEINSADLIISNHALFFTDLRLKQMGYPGVLPEYDTVIFDEGHRIEDVFSKFFQKNISVPALEKLFDRVMKRRSKWSKALLENLDLLREVRSLKARTIRLAISVFSQITRKIKETSKENSGLLRSKLLHENPFHDLLNEFVHVLEKEIQTNAFEKQVIKGVENMTLSILQMREDLDHLFFNKDTNEWANWYTIHEQNEKQLQLVNESMEAYQSELTAAPIQASAVLKNTLFKQANVILTSATLTTTSGDFQYLAKRLGIEKYSGFQVGSPFDFAKQSMLIVPEKSSVIDSLKSILSTTKGSTFVLFTSYREMNDTAVALESFFEEVKLTPLIHTKNVDRNLLLKQFKEKDGCVLFGTESFWEGVDVPGDDLICVVVVKLPFPVPTNPLIEARSTKIEKDNGNPFEMLFLPSCILKLKQGYGRLIRTVNDKGTVVILDSRVLHKRYGKVILDSLPSSPFSKDLKDLKLS